MDSNTSPEPDTSSELEVLAQDDGVLVTGTAEAIDAYIARLREVAQSDLPSSALTKSEIFSIAAVGAGAGAIAAQHGRWVKIPAKSVELIRTNKLIPAGNGYFRPTTMGAGNKFSGQILWKPGAATPARLASIQMLAIQMALTAAIADVKRAVAKVEGKVDDILALTKAQMIGDVIGSHTYLKRLTQEEREHGTLATSDWESIASLGPSLEQGLQKIRAYVTASAKKLDKDQPLGDRASAVSTLATDGRLGEALHLLLITEQSYYYWQRLRLTRVMSTEPTHRERVAASVHNALADNTRLDVELWARLHEKLDGFDRVRPLEIAKFWDVNTLRGSTAALQADLEEFRRARAQQDAEWSRNETPSVRDAINEIGSIAERGYRQVAPAAARGLRGFADLIDVSPNEKSKAVQQDRNDADG